MDFKQKYGEWLKVIDDELNRIMEVACNKEICYEKTIYEAMKYSLLAGGKRLRPVLALAVCELLDGKMENVLPFACAVEMIHTYSLIHDDLPAMDNDEYRRGRLTNHKVFGEAAAILAGDALLNYAFELMTESPSKDENILYAKIKAMNIIAKSSGSSGMIGGQVVDLESEGKSIGADTLEYMHRCKTGALIKAPVIASAILCNADKSEMDSLEKYAEHIGLAFQIKDDILDVEGDFNAMGKEAGSDMQNQKSTFITIYGLDESKRMLQRITDEAIESISIFGEKAIYLKQLAKYLISRNN
ncbi:MAG: polyprenyl synthetase family protein [Clostridia bacterium]|nr:polyprenyl synthetase family protein [Clostridia bacterium]